MINKQGVVQMIQNGEKIDVEFKEAKRALNKDIFDTVCSFNNRDGGTILLGVNDRREIVGVSPDKVDQIIKEFVTSVNNPQKIFPPLYLIPTTIDLDGKKVIVIPVPKGSQVCRHNGKIWDRSHEGDINITDNEALVFNLYARKNSGYFVNKVYPRLNLDCLDAKVIKKARKMAQARSKNHVWKNMKDEELLRTSNLILVDPNTNEEGISLACILLFGKDNTIMSVLPQHKTDAIFRVENKDRYDDRDVVITNLIDSYDRLISFGQKHLNDLFVLDGMVNVNARDLILREIVSNTLAHRDYSSGFPARMIIDDEKIMVENSNLAYRSGILDPKKFHPIAKNPPISKVFREIGIADELGSGMRNTFKYTKLYSGALPTFEEGDIFRTIIPLKRIATEKVGPSNTFIAVRSDDISSDPERDFPVVVHKSSSHVAHGDAHNVAHSDARNVARQNRPPVARVVSPKPAPGTPAINIDLTEFIRLCVAADPTITRKAIAEEAGVSVKTIERYMKAIPNLRYVGRGKYGHWELD